MDNDSPDFYSANFTISNEKGLHTRPCTEIVRLAIQFNSEILLRTHGTVGDAKSVLSLLTLAAEKGTRIDIEAKGKDSQKAVLAIIELAKGGFHLSF